MRLSTLALATAAAAGTSVNIGDLNFPTSFAWDNEHIYISEKSGVIKVASSWQAPNATVLKDISTQVANYGDLGLTSLEVAGGYLYATYMVANPAINDTCDDFGHLNGRPASQVYGCRSYGRVSRWQIQAGPTLGAEEVMFDGNSTACTQFNSGPIDYILAGPDGNMYFSAGTGADTNAVDYGQLGGNPCAAPSGAAFGGAFRSQDQTTYSGKLMRLNPNTREITILAAGFNNPWRFALTENNEDIYIADTGVVTWEEINGPISRSGTTLRNFGWPCLEGNNTPVADYQALNAPFCSANNQEGMLPPFYKYTAPNNQSRVSISALAAANGRLYYGDYSQMKFFSVSRTNSSDVWVEGTGFPVDMAFVPGQGFVIVDIVRGAVKSVSIKPVPSPSAASSFSVALASVFAALVAILALAM